jgi:hypothetical protein
MKILKKLIWCLALLPIATLAQDNKGSLMEITEITVKAGHNAQFLQGVKLWKECYLKNKGTHHWNLWHRVQGKGNVYELTGNMANWAEMDKDDPASKACFTILTNFIMPHVESTEYTISMSMPEFSRPPSEGTKVIQVTFFTVKNGVDFMDVLKGVTSAIKTSEGNLRGFWNRVIGGGPEDPDYFVTEPYKSFADLDKQQDSPWKVYEKVNGKKATDAIRAEMRGSVGSAWSYFYTLNEDLSN